MPVKADAAVSLSKLIPSLQKYGLANAAVHHDYLEPDHFGLERQVAV